MFDSDLKENTKSAENTISVNEVDKLHKEISSLKKVCLQLYTNIIKIFNLDL